MLFRSVEEVGLFVTTLKTVDNLRVYVGNSKIFSDNIVNYTHNPYRRVDLKCQLAHTVDPRDAIAKLKARLPQIPNVIATPAPDVEIIEFRNPAQFISHWKRFTNISGAVEIQDRRAAAAKRRGKCRGGDEASELICDGKHRPGSDPGCKNDTLFKDSRRIIRNGESFA